MPVLMAWAVRPSDTELLKALNYVLSQWKASGRLGEIESHWIRARTYAELAGMAGRAGRTREANSLLEQSIDFADDIACIVSRPRVAGRRDLVGAAAIRIDDRHQRDARQRRQNPGVMLSEVADADDPHSRTHQASTSVNFSSASATATK